MKRRIPWLFVAVLMCAAQSCTSMRSMGVGDMQPGDRAAVESGKGRRVAGYTTRDSLHHDLDGQLYARGDSLVFHERGPQTSNWGAAAARPGQDRVIARSEVTSVDLVTTDMTRSVWCALAVMVPVATLIFVSAWGRGWD